VRTCRAKKKSLIGKADVKNKSTSQAGPCLDKRKGGVRGPRDCEKKPLKNSACPWESVALSSGGARRRRVQKGMMGHEAATERVRSKGKRKGKVAMARGERGGRGMGTAYMVVHRQ